MTKLSGNGVGHIVAALGLTQIIGYGTLYYSFGVLAPSMAADFGWSQEWVYGVLSVSLLLGGLAAPLAGKLADRHGAGTVMSWGSAAAALSLLLCALAPERISFVAGLAAMEVASSFVLYATAFAALAQASSAGAQRSITHLTLIAGFASTIFWPVTSGLQQHMSWRDIYMLYALVNLIGALPIHLWLTRAIHRRRSALAVTPAPDRLPMVAKDRERIAMVMMLTAFALLGFVASAITVHMLPLLGALGLGGAAVMVTTLFGPSQVLSRLVNMQFGRGLEPPALALLAVSVLPLGLVLLVVAAPWAPGAALFAILFGFGNGLSSIVSGTLPLMLFGAVGYGARLGWISSARLVASAAAPLAFAMVASAASTQAAVWFVAAAGVASATAFAAIWLMFGRPTGEAQLAQDAAAQ